MTAEKDADLEKRRARKIAREIRREKQRVESTHRAQAMHASRLQHDRSSPRAKHPPNQPPHIHVGCSGWFYWHWKDVFYPTDLPTREWFPHYASRFRTVELNAPFYSWPTVATVQTWVKQAGRRKFVYTVKASELITHVKRFAGTRTMVRDFGHIADLLGPRMGCFLFQLPPSFHYSAARLKRILDQMDPARRNVVEFRHRSWWIPEVYKAFQKNGTIFCSCSAPKLPEELIPTAGQVYIRFHGRERWYRHDYTRAELAHWAQKVKKSGATKIWAYFNNDSEGYALKNARSFRQLLVKNQGASALISQDDGDTRNRPRISQRS